MSHEINIAIISLNQGKLIFKHYIGLAFISLLRLLRTGVSQMLWCNTLN